MSCIEHKTLDSTIDLVEDKNIGEEKRASRGVGEVSKGIDFKGSAAAPNVNPKIGEAIC